MVLSNRKCKSTHIFTLLDVVCASWFYLLFHAFWSHWSTFSQFQCLFSCVGHFLCFNIWVLHHNGPSVCLALFCFISCSCFNSNPSSYHAFPAVDLKMVYEYDKLSMWSSCGPSLSRSLAGPFPCEFFARFVVYWFRKSSINFFFIFYVCLSIAFVHLKALQCESVYGLHLIRICCCRCCYYFFLGEVFFPLSSYSLPSVIISQIVRKENIYKTTNLFW